MWEEWDVVGVHPVQWGVLLGLYLVGPWMAALLWWNRTAIDGDLLARAVVGWGLTVLLGMGTAAWYNLTARLHGGLRVWWAGGDIVAVDATRAAAVGLALAPPAAGLGGALWALNLVPPPLPWPWLVAVALPAAAWAALAGSAWLYTWVVGGVGQHVVVELSTEQGPALRRVDPDRFRTAIATLLFAWVVGLAVLGVLGLWAGLIAVAHHLPAGYFGLGVGLFFGFVLAVAGLLLAIVLGLWSRVVVWVYNRWAARYGGLRLALARRPLSLG
jgi:hypothetical protein